MKFFVSLRICRGFGFYFCFCWNIFELMNYFIIQEFEEEKGVEGDILVGQRTTQLKSEKKRIYFKLIKVPRLAIEIHLLKCTNTQSTNTHPA